MATLCLRKEMSIVSARGSTVALKPLAYIQLLNAELFGAYLIKDWPIGEIKRGIIELQQRKKTSAVITKYISPPDSRISVWALCDAYRLLKYLCY